MKQELAALVHRMLYGRRTKVFGIGLNKTGTTTLRLCLQTLGYRHYGYSRQLLAAFRRGDLEPALRIAELYDSVEDWPWPLMYRELFDKFGSDARYVLTVRRDPDVWLNSLKAHSLRTKPNFHGRKLAYGYDYPHGYEGEHIAFYEQHNAEVRAFFHGRDDIFMEVCWEAGDGWEKLCRFLGHPVPAVAFPHANSSKAATSAPNPNIAENQALIDSQLARLKS